MIIDRDGVDGFNIRKLGEALGVNGASLYHHYENKTAIFEDTARLVLSKVEPPNPFEDDFVESAVRSSHGYRDALLTHPNAIPLMLQRRPSEGRPLAIAHLVTGFTRYGVSLQHALWGIESLESLVIGSALVQSSRDQDGQDAKAKAKAANKERAYFEGTLRAVLASIISRK